MIIGSIDNGKHGGVCINENGKLSYYNTPLIGEDEIDANTLLNLIKDCDVVVCEQLHSIYGSSASSNFEFGKSNGVLDAVLQISKLPFIKFQPKEWQKFCFKGIDKIVKNGKTDTKGMALIAARRLYPNETFIDHVANPKKRVPHDGIVDAVLINYYYENGYRQN